MDEQNEFEVAVQNAVEKELNPVRFGIGEKILLWTLLALAVAGTTASILTLALTI